MISEKLHFEILFPSTPTSVVDVWSMLKTFLAGEKCLPQKFQLSQILGHKEGLRSERALFVGPDDVADLIVSRGLDGFRLNTGHSGDAVSYSLAPGKEGGRPAALSCGLGVRAIVPSDWKRLIESILMRWSTIGGFQFNKHYCAWQNCSEVETHLAVFGSIPRGARTNLVRSVDGIGPDRTFMDISGNPGRRLQVSPLVGFTISAEMWLGPHFWEHAPCTKEDVLAAEFFLEKKDTLHFLYLKSWPKPFTRPDGEQGRVQQKLWRLLFHEDCEWPPGSGSISDVPVYGPPELMPKAET